MKTWRHLLILAAFAATHFIMTARAGAADLEEVQVQRRLQEIFNATENKDFTRLDSYHMYGPKFSKFANDSLSRQTAAIARQKEHDSIAHLTGLKLKADDLKIDVFGEAAVATFIANADLLSGTNAVQKKARATLVFTKDKGEWKIVHEHFSALEMK